MATDYEKLVLDNLANTAFKPFELPAQVTRMSERNMENIKVYPKTIMVHPVNDNTYVDLTNTANFKNPTINLTTNYSTVCNNIVAINGLLDIVALFPIANACNNAIIPTELFAKHTDRISGVVKIGTVECDPEDPLLIPAAEVGKSLEYLNYISTGEKNNTAFQNVFSSVFQSTIDSLETKVANTANLVPIITSSISGGEGAWITSLTTQQISNYANVIIEVYSTMDSHRLSDKSDYASLIATQGGRSTVYNVISNTFTSIFDSITGNMTF